MRKVGIWVAVVAAVGTAVLGGWQVWRSAGGPQPQAPDDRALGRVRVGMTRGEVTATLGVPPGQYSVGGFYIEGDYYRGYDAWVCPERSLLVRFDGDGIATDVVRKSTFYRTRSTWGW